MLLVCSDSLNFVGPENHPKGLVLAVKWEVRVTGPDDKVVRHTAEVEHAGDRFKEYQLRPTLPGDHFSWFAERFEFLRYIDLFLRNDRWLVGISASDEAETLIHIERFDPDWVYGKRTAGPTVWERLLGS